ncbi:MAG: NACHT domain-containing protein, partial [Acidobacteria bacterium]|nr:NACHT domain-containing protein [Acidobacteriota bacterium]
RQAIRMTLEATVEWGTPVLHMHSRDGHLFHVDQAIFPEPAPSPPMEPQPRQPVKPEASSPAAGSERDLQILLSRVREYWIAGVLERSIHRFARLELGMELLEGAVESPWGSLLETPGAGREELPHGKTLGQVFEDVGGSLLVLGEPGSGKTTTLLELAQDLLRGAEDDPTSPVPVVFPLSSWAGEGRSLGDWMVDELAKKYMVPKKVSRAWPGGGRILPLLDGLDEVEGGQRPRCVEAINLFTRENPVRVVVCCRLREYRELPVRLALNGAIRLQPLSRQQVFDYLGAFGDRLAALGALLRRDSGLLIDARSPLMLSLMIEAYQGLPVEALATEGRPSVAARRQRLMEAYVEARFHRARTGLYHARP